METKALVSLIFLLQAIIPGVKPSNQNFICSKNGNFASDNLLKERDSAFDILLKKLRTSSEPYPGYETASSSGVWTVSLCPPHTRIEDCRTCVSNTIPYLKKNCPKQKEGVAFSIFLPYYCMVRYADNAQHGNIFVFALFSTPDNQLPTLANAGVLEKALNDMSNKLKGMVTGLNNNRYGHGSITYGPGPRIMYGSMQCTPDQTTEECAKCLSDATNEIHKCCSKLRKTGGQVMSQRCAFRYEHYMFFPKTLPAI